jgi:hypothetical protein
VKYEAADLSPIAVDNVTDKGVITFTKTFKLVGSTLAYNLKDNYAIECRIKSTQGSFSSILKQFFQSKYHILRQFFCAKGIKNSHKETAYEG